MKRFVLLVIVAAALAAVPVAFGDTAPPPSIQTTPSGQTQGQGQSQGQGKIQSRIEQIRKRLALIEQRFDKRCGTTSSTASQKCKDFAQKAEDRLGTLDTRLQALITKGQQAGKNVDRLTKLDSEVQALIAKIHAWLSS